MIIFLGVFFFSFFVLFSTDFIIKTLSNKVVVIYLLSFICYFIGYLAVMYTKKPITNYDAYTNKMNSGYVSNCLENDNEKKSMWLEIKVLATIYISSLLIYYGCAVKLFGLENVFKNILLFHEIDVVNLLGPYGKIVLYIKKIGFFLSPYSLVFYLTYREKKIKTICFIFLTLIGTISYTRNLFIYICIIDMFIILYMNQKEKKKISFMKVIIVAVVGVAIINLFAITQSLFNKVFNVNGSFLGIPISSSVATIISYLCGTLISTDMYLLNVPQMPPLGFTMWVLYDLLDLLGANFNVDQYVGQYFVNIPFKFNTSTVQYYIFSEGGYIWIVFFFLFFGGISAVVWRKYMSAKNANSTMILALVSLISVTMIRSYMLLSLDVVIFIFLLIITACRTQHTYKKNYSRK